MFLQYLWGIETRNDIWKYTQWHVFLQYLWGIETCLNIHQKVQKYLVFTVPMRNWNNHISVNPASLSLGFYSTYEELKQNKNWNVSNYFYRFYSTYEELKPISSFFSSHLLVQFLQYLWGIETLHIPSMKRCSQKVFTVPMRNWNYCITLYIMLSSPCFYSTYEELKLTH